MAFTWHLQILLQRSTLGSGSSLRTFVLTNPSHLTPPQRRHIGEVVISCFTCIWVHGFASCIPLSCKRISVTFTAKQPFSEVKLFSKRPAGLTPLPADYALVCYKCHTLKSSVVFDITLNDLLAPRDLQIHPIPKQLAPQLMSLSEKLPTCVSVTSIPSTKSH